MREQRIIALLGRRDAPTDAVEDYCRYLSEALSVHDIQMEVARVSWAEQGWTGALRELRQKAHGWRGEWVLVQYTALSWSARGFPVRFLRVLKILRELGARTAIVFHDVEPYSGARVVDRLRRVVQIRTMRQALRHADLAVFTVPLSAVSWVEAASGKTTFIPVGANLPAPRIEPRNPQRRDSGKLRIAVFGITGGKRGEEECGHIVEAVRFVAAKVDRLEVYVFGRHADDFDSVLRAGLRGLPVDLRVEGVLPAERVAAELKKSDVMLFVRGPISTQRGSAIAGIACGLPVIAYEGPQALDCEPIARAGVVLVSAQEPGKLGAALLEVVTNDDYRHLLAERSGFAQEHYFSWRAIAMRYIEELQKLP